MPTNSELTPNKSQCVHANKQAIFIASHSRPSAYADECHSKANGRRFYKFLLYEIHAREYLDAWTVRNY